MPDADFSKPNPNDSTERRRRNNALGEHVKGESNDIVEIYLETLSDGSTQWMVVLRDGTRYPRPN